MSLQITEETTFLLDMDNLITYGAELNTLSNAIADPNGTEANATTGWSESGLNGTGANVFEPQGAVKSAGSYAFHCDSTDTPTSGARIYIDLQAAPFSFTNGEGGKVTFDLRHIATGLASSDWGVYLSALDTGVDNLVANVAVTDAAFAPFSYTWTHDANYRYLIVRENNTNQRGGAYFDNLSIKKKL